MTVAQPLNGDMNVGRAMDKLQAGCTMARRAWKEGSTVKYHMPVKYSSLKVLTIYYYFNGAIVGMWEPKQADTLADDWYEITGE